MRSYGTRVLASAAVLALSFSASAQRPHPRNPPALPRTSHSSRPVAPGAANLVLREEASPSGSLNASTWTAIGPASLSSGGGLVSGRVTGIAVDPTNSSNIYLATAGGGVWNTTNGGTSWTPLTDTQTTLAMGSIAIAPTNHLKIYAGTGEANNSLDSNHGAGILVSDDGGSTWTLETASGAFAGVVIGQIAVDPTNADVAYAAVGGYGLNGNNLVNTGIWKTTDGGTTWTNMTAASPNNLDSASAWSAVVIDPTTPTSIYAAIGAMDGGTGNNGIYRSTNSGVTWSFLANGPNQNALPTIGRIALAVSPAAKTAGKHVLYVAVAGSPYTSTGGLIYFGRSDTADGASPGFTNLTSGTPDFLGAENGSGQGWYDIALNVDANGIVYASGVENYGAGGADAIITSSNLGVTWTDISIVNNVQPHTDNHAIAFDSSNRMLAGNDGGIYRYDRTVPSWTDLNSNLNTIQFTGIGLHPTDLGTVVGGSQDNGTELYSDNLLWVERIGGDGGYAKISQTNPLHCYHEYTGASIERSDDGCMTFTVSIYSGIFSNIPDSPDSSDFYAPYTLDPANGDHILFGTDYVSESTNAGSSWTALGTPGTNNFNPGDSPVDSIALSPTNGSNPAVVYAATGGSFASTSRIFVTSNGGAAWTEHDLPACPSSCRVNEIVADPNDLTGHTAFAVTNSITGGGRHVYRTTNEGANWTDITHNLPDSPTWSVQVDTDASHTAYISNETGVYSSPSPYSSWTLYGTGLPHAQGVDLELNSSLHVLALATHGRGAWEILTPSGFALAAITSPAPSTVLPGPTVPFSWTAANGATGYYLWVGTTKGTSNLYTSGKVTTLTVTPPSLPTDGETLYVRLFTAYNSTLVYTDYTYTAATRAALTSPTAGTVLPGPIVPFSWTAAKGATGYYLWVGTTKGTSNLYTSGKVTTLTVTPPSLPTDGETLYVRLFTAYNSTLVYTDYTYTAATRAAIISPAPTVLPGPIVPFSWTAAKGATGYYLWVGTTKGTSNLYTSGKVTTLTVTPTVLPTDGETLYVRLFTAYNSTLVYTDYTYTAATRAAIISPAPTVLPGPIVPFSWTAANGATGYYLWVGTTKGTSNLYTSGKVTTLTVTPTSLPTDGETLYVRLFTAYNSTLVYTDYTYTAATRAAIISPAPSTVLPGPIVPFSWTAAKGATGYYLWLGTTPGTSNLYTSGKVTTLTVTSPSLPTDGETLYVRLFTAYNSTLVYTDYTYTAATRAAIISPAPSTVLPGPIVPFSWTAAKGATGYYLWVGTTKGTSNLYTSGKVTTLTVTPTVLPTDGETLYVRLFTAYNSTLVYTDYTYTAAP